MRKIHFFMLLLASTNVAYCQDGEGEYKQPSKKSQEYHDYRQYESTPPYGLQKIQALLNKRIKVVEDENGDGGTAALDQKTYNGLSLREKFTYTMIHGESYSQNCDVEMTEIDEEKKIFGHLLDKMGEHSWSDRQREFLKANRDSVMFLIKESASRSKRMGLNYKDAILEINGVEFIPFLIEFYNQQKKDGDILTVLNLLMRQNNYATFVQSQTFKKLYEDDAGYMAFIDYNKANEQLIIQRATGFHKMYMSKDNVYRRNRTFESTPPYGLAKVKEIVKNLENDDEGQFGSRAADAKTYNSLSVREKFTYTMIYGESFSQICALMPEFPNQHEKILAHFPDILGDRAWSTRQLKFLVENRDSVFYLMKADMEASGRMGLNYKMAISEMNGVEFIPVLLSFYNKGKNDGDILTLLNILMRENKYKPFMASEIYQDLYSNGATYLGYVNYNKVNEDFIIKNATEFFNGLAKN